MGFGQYLISVTTGIDTHTNTFGTEFCKEQGSGLPGKKDKNQSNCK